MKERLRRYEMEEIEHRRTKRAHVEEQVVGNKHCDERDDKCIAPGEIHGAKEREGGDGGKIGHVGEEA